jgi:cytochrome c553
MTEERVFTLRNRWFTVSVGAVLLIAALAGLVGFVWMPYSRANSAAVALWDAICSAAGAQGAPRASLLAQDEAARPSNVIVTAQMMRPADAASIGRGATLAMQCTMCHGIRGVSDANSPNLAGQVEAAMYKQLRDYKSGHRTSAIMKPRVENLSDQDMRDLAAYYAYLPRERHHVVAEMPAPRLVTNGAPMRNIGACASCHGGIAGKTATPILDGEPELYIRNQMAAFRSGARRNDLNQAMRNAARQMTEQEVAEVAAYYARR